MTTAAPQRPTGAGHDLEAILDALGLKLFGTLPGYHQADLDMDGVVQYQGPARDQLKIMGTVPTATGIRKSQVPQ